MAALYARSDILQFVRDEIHEPTARIFTDTEINQMIDMGAKACSGLTMCNQTEEDEDLVVSSYVYKPDTQFIRIESVSWVDEDVTGDPMYGLQRIHPQAYGHVTINTIGLPKYYWVHWVGGTYNLAQIYILPAPDAATSNGTEVLRIQGYSTVESFGDGAAETLPDNLQIIPLYYALANVYARLGKHSLGAHNMQKFIDECNRSRFDVFGDVGRVDSHDLTRTPDVSVVQQ